MGLSDRPCVSGYVDRTWSATYFFFSFSGCVSPVCLLCLLQVTSALCLFSPTDSRSLCFRLLPPAQVQGEGISAQEGGAQGHLEAFARWPQSLPWGDGTDPEQPGGLWREQLPDLFPVSVVPVVTMQKQETDGGWTGRRRRTPGVCAASRDGHWGQVLSGSPLG